MDEVLGEVEIGVVTKPQGVAGAFKIRLHNPDSTTLNRIELGRVALVGETGQRRTGVRVLGRQGEFVVAKVSGVSRREAAEALRGAVLVVPRDCIALDAGEYLYADLIGCSVWEQQRCLGVVKDVFCAGASDILVIVEGHDERLIPFVDDWVVSVDVHQRRIEIRDGARWEPHRASP